jgi:hypothetical protein
MKTKQSNRPKLIGQVELTNGAISPIYAREPGFIGPAVDACGCVFFKALFHFHEIDKEN